MYTLGKMEDESIFVKYEVITSQFQESHIFRANGTSYVCDVNGFSFVKNSVKYYDDCAKILGNLILKELSPKLNIPWYPPVELEPAPIVPTTYGKM